MNDEKLSALARELVKLDGEILRKIEALKRFFRENEQPNPFTI